MRILFVLAALFTLAAAPPARDWRTTAVTTPSGSFAIGNPAAPVKLVEYLSFTCPHCGHFVAESKTALHDGWVRNGSVRVETRAAMRDAYDVAAWTVARCAGPARFDRLSRAIFAQQDVWTTRGSTWAQANLAKLKAMPERAQVRAIADNSGLSAIAARTGLTPAALTACLATDVQRKQLMAMTDAAFAKIPGTPGFEINGALVEGFDWATLEPQLRAAGAR
ncbi:DsbA family protein [Sphingomonas donggukensis]|uniref:DsbA family protein n=1 Tax=Sphingomonas donggukensis TaxID=2949093 RepID=A0ABY4TV06_9SPHN|nr:thioredoxin domain-containing protein [Sphingomonas donggukensis]URW75004.1 DsbA family protein [Sphingomonas donggukensis]